MAFNTGELLAHTFDCAAKASDFDFAAWSGAVTTVLSVMHFPHSHLMANGKPFDEAGLRKTMAAAADAAGINKGTWQTYVGGMFKAAKKLADASTGDATLAFHALPSMSSEDACANVELWLRGLGMETGKHILAWSKQDGFGAYDPDAAKKAREAKAKADGLMNVALLGAIRSDAPLPSVQALPARDDYTSSFSTPATNALDAIPHIRDMAAALEVMAALNARIAELQAMVDGAPAPDKITPVVRDDATIAKLSSLGRVKHVA